MADEEEDEGGGNAFGWFLVGLGLGAAIGVLYAPQGRLRYPGQHRRGRQRAGGIP